MAVPASSLLGSIPIPRTRLIGRHAERAAARAWLLEEAVPLLTLTGPGGVGKTRLALAIAHDVAETFADGVAWVDLALLTDPDLVPTTVATALGMSLTPSGPVQDDLIRYLRPRQILLLLDNCERVLANTADLLAALMPSCPALQVLATSRAPFHVSGEQILSVEPLPLPTGDATPLAMLSHNEAVCLFVERARAVAPTFTLTENNAPAVAALCRQLDGLPLAIELAAARVRILSPEALLAQMSHQLQLLSSGARDLPARQQAIRDTIAWSYDLLDPQTQALFRRLGVFMGGFTLDAVEAIGQERDGGWKTEDEASPTPVFRPLSSVLDTLVEQSLVRRLEGTAKGGPRWTMLETIREFALERLAESGEADTIRAAHARHFAGLAGEIEAARSGLADVRIADLITHEASNLRAALAWLRSGDPSATLRMAASLWPLWLEHGAVTEGRVLLEECLARPDARDDLVVWARAAATLAMLVQVHGDHALVAAWSAAALETDPENDARVAGMALAARGLDALVQGNFQQAGDDLSQARQRFGAVRDPRSGSWALRHLATIAYRTGEGDALTLAQEGLVIAEVQGNALDVAKLLHTLGVARAARGDLAGAALAWRESLHRFRENGDNWGIADALSSLGAASFESGNAARGRRLLLKALEGFKRIGDPEGTALTLGRIGWVMRALGDLDAAERHFDACLNLARSSSSGLQQRPCLHGLAATAVSRRDTTMAAIALRDALGAPGASATRPMLADGIEWGAHLLAALDQPRRSAQVLGAVTAFRERLNVSALPSMLREREVLVASLRSDLTHATFALECATGQGWPITTAIQAILDVGAATASDPAVRRLNPLDDLSPREREVLMLLRERYSDLEIAEHLFISRRTASHHVGNIMAKLGAANRRDAAAVAARFGQV
jgi:predicted ATPase/DNA-binding CsgD family transcriptional regulator